MINHLSSITSHQSPIINHESSIISHQSSVINHLSSIISQTTNRRVIYSLRTGASARVQQSSITTHQSPMNHRPLFIHLEGIINQSSIINHQSNKQVQPLLILLLLLLRKGCKHEGSPITNHQSSILLYRSFITSINRSSIIHHKHQSIIINSQSSNLPLPSTICGQVQASVWVRQSPIINHDHSLITNLRSHRASVISQTLAL